MIKLIKRFWWGLLAIPAMLFVLSPEIYLMMSSEGQAPWESNPDDYYVERIDTVGWERVECYSPERIEMRVSNVVIEDGDTVSCSVNGTIVRDTSQVWQPVTQPVYKKKILGKWTEDEMDILRAWVEYGPPATDSAAINSMLLREKE